MPTVKPFYPSETLLKLEFLINNKNTGLDSLLKEATVHFELNKISFAKFTFLSSKREQNSTEKLPIDVLSRKPTDPPLEIEVKIAFENKSETLFKGIIKSLDSQESNDLSIIKIECKDKAYRLALSTKEVENNNQTFEDKMTLFAKDLVLSDTLQGQEWGKEHITHNTSTVPWDYLIGFLDSIGMPIALRNANFTGIDILKEKKEITYLAENGINVFSFSGKTDPQKIKSAVTIEGWDIEKQELNKVTTSQNAADNPHSVKLSQMTFQLGTVDRIAKAILVKSNIAAINGRVTTFGNLKAKVGDYIGFNKVNPDIDTSDDKPKPLLITQETHTIEGGCWKTEYGFGLESEKSFTENTTPGTNNGHAEVGQSNKINGLQIGVVTQIVEDPNNQFRIKVRMPVLSESGEGVWARLATLNASNEMGSYFIPSIGDEVIVGCLGNNPDTPIILGSLYSSTKSMPFPIKEENYLKGFVTKEGTRIIMDDEKKSIELSTKKGNILTISDDLKGFVIEDENKNKITLNDQGITIESCKDLNIKAKGSIKVEGMQVAVDATAKMDLKGAIINLN
ncbi:MAG: phage baseplate assembly protein V [Flavobacterium sp.]